MSTRSNGVASHYKGTAFWIVVLAVTLAVVNGLALVFLPPWAAVGIAFGGGMAFGRALGPFS